MSTYNIRLKGHLDPRWRAVFAGFTITHEYTPDHQPITVMTGPLEDQSSLYGMISRLRDLGAALISFQEEKEEE